VVVDLGHVKSVPVLVVISVKSAMVVVVGQYVLSVAVLAFSRVAAA
jgi:hypothetical protein